MPRSSTGTRTRLRWRCRRSRRDYPGRFAIMGAHDIIFSSNVRMAAPGQSFAFVDRPCGGRSAPKAVIPWCAGRPVKSPFCAALWGKPHSRPTYSVWAEAGFPAFTLYACKSMLRFSFTRSSITSERTSLLFFFGKVLRYSMIACHSLTSIEELAPAPRTA